MVTEPASFDEALAVLGELLEERGFSYELLAIGGGALQLLGLITRSTKDIDIVAIVEDGDLTPVAALPGPLQAAVVDTADLLRLSVEWFNVGPRALLDFGLPGGALDRAHRRQWGGLVLHLANRRDQICFKLYAAVDQGPRSKHFDDLRRLEPTIGELRAAATWARSHDPSAAFAAELRAALLDVGGPDAIG